MMIVALSDVAAVPATVTRRTMTKYW